MASKASWVISWSLQRRGVAGLGDVGRRAASEPPRPVAPATPGGFSAPNRERPPFRRGSAYPAPSVV
jgi:hypothetical protein